jgi:hypothetical protein
MSGAQHDLVRNVLCDADSRNPREHACCRNPEVIMKKLSAACVARDIEQWD